MGASPRSSPAIESPHDLLLSLQAPALIPSVPLCGASVLLGSDELLLAGLLQIFYLDLALISPMSHYLPVYLSLLRDVKVGETRQLILLLPVTP